MLRGDTMKKKILLSLFMIVIISLLSTIAYADTFCDGLDDNTDGTIDEGCDDDGDTYCDSEMPRLAGASCVSTDCNDANSLINPRATESCLNGYDDNCNGAVNEGCAPTCGNGVVEWPEVCDDGANNGDRKHCSACTCVDEDGS